MGILESSFIKTDLKYNSGIAIDVYNNEFSIATAVEGKDGKLYLKWSFPQTKDKKPTEKAIPHRIILGVKQVAIQRLEQLIHYIESAGSELASMTIFRFKEVEPDPMSKLLSKLPWRRKDA